MKSIKIIILTAILLIISSSTLYAVNFKDSFTNYINSEMRVYIKYASGVNATGMYTSSSSFFFDGILTEVQEDYIKIVSGNKDIVIKIDDISSYSVKTKSK